jgi:4'-phosphopantetheinyl transferase
VGVDIQRLERGRPLRRLARRYFSESERAVLESLHDDAFDRHFFRLWALKEAWTKARGEALPTALGSTAFSLDGTELVSLTPEQTRDTSLWLLQLESYALAVCGLAGGLSLRFQRWSGAGAAPGSEARVLAQCGAGPLPDTR